VSTSQEAVPSACVLVCDLLQHGRHERPYRCVGVAEPVVYSAEQQKRADGHTPACAVPIRSSLSDRDRLNLGQVRLYSPADRASLNSETCARPDLTSFVIPELYALQLAYALELGERRSDGHVRIIAA
jgi:hypothetical protein